MLAIINKKKLYVLITFLMTAGISLNSIGQSANREPWTANQLMPPLELAKIINDKNADQPIVFSIGPDATIKGSLDIGPAQNRENLDKLKQQLSRLPKDANIVIYCGCCPFDHCPNIRPAFTLLNKMKFTHQKLLSLQHNIKIDWINKGFPVNK